MFRKKKPIPEDNAELAGAMVGKKPVGKRKSVLLLIGGILVLVIIGSAIYISQNSSSSGCTQNGQSPLYTDAANALNNTDVKPLEKVVKRILKQDNFEKDYSCLYPVVAYYIRSNDAAKSEEYFSAFKSVKIKRLADVYKANPYEVTTDFSAAISQMKLMEGSKNDK